MEHHSLCDYMTSNCVDKCDCYTAEFKARHNKSNTLDNSDVVHNPSHYQFFPGVEAIELIALVLTEEGFKGYCLGNRLKYRLRAGKKDDPKQELDKSDFYVQLFEQHKHLCRNPEVPHEHL